MSGSACLRSGPRPPSALLAAGASAARALADLPVEFVAGDPAALAQRLGPRLALAPPLAPGLRLVGARLAPGSQATATLYLYENSRGERVALMVEPLDETVAAAARRGEADGLSVAAWTGAGYGFVAAAAEDADVAALVAAAGADDRFAGRRRRSAPVARFQQREDCARRLHLAALRRVGARLGVPGVDVEMRPGLGRARRSARRNSAAVTEPAKPPLPALSRSAILLSSIVS